MERCISRVETMLPAIAPSRPTRAGLRKPFPIIKTTTTNPMPKAVPKLVRETSWYFLK